MNCEQIVDREARESPDESWVQEVLEADQLSRAKKLPGRLRLSGKTVWLLWGLRVYVALMVLMIAFQIWSAFHGGAS